MRVLKVPEGGAKKKLLDATERLVVEKGFDLVSVRDVTGAVKANVAAVNYHFGSREGLMDLLTLRLLEPLNEERIKSLGLAERKRAGKMASVEDIVCAFVKPLTSTASHLGMETRFFLSLAARILVLNDVKILPSLAAERKAVTERYLTALGRALPKAPSKEIAASWRIFDAGLSQGLLTLGKDEDPAAMMNQWIAFAVRGLGNTSASAAEPEKDDSQGMLFDF